MCFLLVLIHDLTSYTAWLQGFNCANTNLRLEFLFSTNPFFLEFILMLRRPNKILLSRLVVTMKEAQFTKVIC